MPWKVEDVDKHKKGLSQEEKEKWVSVANNAYDSCMKENDDDSVCAPKAIKIANDSTKSEKDTFSGVFFKKDLDKGIVYGVIFEPDYIDLQNEFLTKEDIEDSAHTYLMHYRGVKLSHKDEIQAAIVESYLAPISFEFNGELIKEGSWIIGMKIFDEEILSRIEGGEIIGFSPGGTKQFI